MYAAFKTTNDFTLLAFRPQLEFAAVPLNQSTCPRRIRRYDLHQQHHAAQSTPRSVLRVHDISRRHAPVVHQPNVATLHVPRRAGSSVPANPANPATAAFTEPRYRCRRHPHPNPQQQCVTSDDSTTSATSTSTSTTGCCSTSARSPRHRLNTTIAIGRWSTKHRPPACSESPAGSYGSVCIACARPKINIQYSSRTGQ